MIIYSRFNCEHYAGGGIWESKMRRLRFNPSWLQRRLTLFDRFTYPTVTAQTDQDFQWIGIVHPDTPRWFLDQLEMYSRIEIVKAVLDQEVATRGVRSMNLDTDDGIAADFVARAKALPYKGEMVFNRGIKYKVEIDLAEPSLSVTNHFNVVNHKRMSVLDFNHGSSSVRKVCKVDKPMWLQVIHEDNISNRLRPASQSKPHDFELVRQHFPAVKSWR